MVNLIVPGTVVLNVPGAPGGGYGPGTYGYPTATNSPGVPTFPPGAFELNGLTVTDSGSTVTFQVGMANLVPTFGPLDGAQLVDLYIHAPSATHDRVPVDGGGQPVELLDRPGGRLEPADRGGRLRHRRLGDAVEHHRRARPAPRASARRRYLVAQLSATSSGATPGVISITVPASTLGAPGSGGSWSGWTFTVALTGQDGFGFDDARTVRADTRRGTVRRVHAAIASEASPPAICSLQPEHWCPT